MASSYPPWQHATLNTLKEMYNQLGGNFPDNRDIMNRMKEIPEVKSAMKKLMPFVQHVKVLKYSCCIFHSYNVINLNSKTNTEVSAIDCHDCISQQQTYVSPFFFSSSPPELYLLPPPTSSAEKVSLGRLHKRGLGKGLRKRCRNKF